MSLENNTIELQAILDSVNALPEAGGEANPIIEPLTVTKNGTYNTPDGVDGYNPIVVNVATSGGDTELEKRLMEREFTSYSNPTLTTLGTYALAGTVITELDLPKLTTIKPYAFYECNKLAEMIFPELTTIEGYAFTGCKSATTVVCPKLTTVPINGFRQFDGVVTADFHTLKSIGANGFYKCTNLETLIIRTPTLCSLASGTVMTATKILNKTGYIYTPFALLDSYKEATNWSVLADQFRAIEDYTADGTVNGEFTGVFNQIQMPDGYTPVDYIQFTGEQTIDTGIVPNQDTRIEVTFTRETSDAVYLYGVRSTNNTASITAYLNTNGAWRFGNTYANVTPTVRDAYHNVIQGNGGVTLNGTANAYKATVGDFTTHATLTIGSARATDGSYGDPSYVGKITTVRMYSGDKLVLRYTPCKNADGVFGFWDSVSESFKASITDVELQGA